MMNKKGQSTGLAIMGLITFIIIGFVCINFLASEIPTARTALSCSDASNISDGTKLLCLVVGITIPYWVWIIISVGVGFVIAKIIL